MELKEKFYTKKGVIKRLFVACTIYVKKKKVSVGTNREWLKPKGMFPDVGQKDLSSNPHFSKVGFSNFSVGTHLRCSLLRGI